MDRPPKTATSAMALAPPPPFLAQKPKIAKPFLPAPPFSAQKLKIAKRSLTPPSFLAQKPEDRQDRQLIYMAIFTALAILTWAPGPRLAGKNTTILSTALGIVPPLPLGCVPPPPASLLQLRTANWELPTEFRTTQHVGWAWGPQRGILRWGAPSAHAVPAFPQPKETKEDERREEDSSTAEDPARPPAATRTFS